jgi:hypothetical protein
MAVPITPPPTITTSAFINILLGCIINKKTILPTNISDQNQIKGINPLVNKMVLSKISTIYIQFFI